MRVYRLLIRLYPRRFRQEHTDDLVEVFEAMVRDGSPATVWRRTVRDLSISVPVEHVAALQAASPYELVAAIAAAIVLCASVTSVVVGRPSVLVVSVLVIVAASSIGVRAWRQGRPLQTHRPVTSAWWRALLAGGFLLAVAVGLAVASSDDFGRWYWPWLISSLSGLTLIGVGALLGVGHLVWGRRVALAGA